MDPFLTRGLHDSVLPPHFLVRPLRFPCSGRAKRVGYDRASTRQAFTVNRTNYHLDSVYNLPRQGLQ